MNWERFVFFGVLFVIIVGVIYRLKLAGIPGLKVTSWWRTPWHNYKVGGVELSRHQIGWGFDVVPAGSDTVRKLREAGFGFVLDEGDHVHAEIIKRIA